MARVDEKDVARLQAGEQCKLNVLQLAFNDCDARQIRGFKQRAQKLRVRFNKRAFKAPIKVSLVSIEEEGGSVARTYLDDPGGPDFAHHAVENDCVTPRVGWVIERISIVIILIFRKGNLLRCT